MQRLQVYTHSSLNQNTFKTHKQPIKQTRKKHKVKNTRFIVVQSQSSYIHSPDSNLDSGTYSLTFFLTVWRLCSLYNLLTHSLTNLSYLQIWNEVLLWIFKPSKKTILSTSLFFRNYEDTLEIRILKTLSKYVKTNSLYTENNTQFTQTMFASACKLELIKVVFSSVLSSLYIVLYSGSFTWMLSFHLKQKITNY